MANGVICKLEECCNFLGRRQDFFCSQNHHCKWKIGENNPNYRGGKITKLCKYQKGTINEHYFEVYPYRKNIAKFCNNECQGKWMEENLSGKKSPFWQGGSKSEMDRICNRKKFKELKARIFQRDNFECRLCNSGKNIETHHIYPKTEYKELSYNMDNIITLCKKCHDYFNGSELSFVDFFERII